MTIYIVRRESAEGTALDLFTDPELAEEWADHLGEVAYEEEAIDRETLDLMKQTQPNMQEEEE